MKILVDIAGADAGLAIPVKAIVNVIDKVNIDICIVAKKEDVKNELNKLGKKDYLEKINIIECEEYISNNDDPVNAIKYKKSSNISKAFEYMKSSSEPMAFISSSNTGALMAGALLKLGRIASIVRPALATILPTSNDKKVIFLDTGANPEAKDISLVQYAMLGDIYAKKMLGVENPKIALLNIGREEEKGTPVLKQVNKKLKDIYKDRFFGNIEARYILKGEADVIVADGLMGNVAIKSLEGSVSILKNELKNKVKSSALNKLKGLIIKSMIKDVMQKFNYKEHEGAVLLGVKKPVIKVHGSSNSITYEKAIFQAEAILKNNIIECISEKLEEELNR